MQYSKIPMDSQLYTSKIDKKYSKFANYYDLLITFFPLWKIWLKKVIPFITGPKVLGVSFGTEYLMTKYADNFDVYGLDYNDKMIQITEKNLREKVCLLNLKRQC